MQTGRRHSPPPLPHAPVYVFHVGRGRGWSTARRGCTRQPQSNKAHQTTQHQRCSHFLLYLLCLLHAHITCPLAHQRLFQPSMREPSSKITHTTAALRLQPHEPQAVLKLPAFLIGHAHAHAHYINWNEQLHTLNLRSLCAALQVVEAAGCRRRQGGICAQQPRAGGGGDEGRGRALDGEKFAVSGHR